MEHISVLLNECIEGLAIREDGIYVDGTLGRAGHSKEILKKLTTGHLYSFDIDQSAIDESRPILEEIGNNFTLIKANFACMKEELAKLGVEKVDGILLDIGVSSPQFDDPERGFSYRYDTRLDMRMDQSQQLDAYQIVNEYSEQQLTRIFFEYGEEKFSRSIARNIVKEREKGPIETTGQLVEIIRASMPAKVVNSQGHPGKKIFQSLRIETNSELENLKKAIAQALSLLSPKGRLAIISFHSLEDEIVKKAFREASSEEKIDKRIPIRQCDIKQSEFVLVNHKPITSKDEELQMNHRAHSAKLRIIEKRS